MLQSDANVGTGTLASVMADTSKMTPITPFPAPISAGDGMA
jgi:hypothetical protein